MSHEYINDSDEERIRRHRQRIEEMKVRKRRAELFQRRVFPGMLLVAMVLILGMIVKALAGGREAEEQHKAVASANGENVIFLTQEQLDSETEDSNLQKPSEETGALDGEGEAQTKESESSEAVALAETPAVAEETPPAEASQPEVYTASANNMTCGFGAEVLSSHGVIIDVENAAILAQKESKTRMSPASMTKILTVLTAANALDIGENWQSNPILDEKFTITVEITDYSFVNDCSNVGFSIGEEVTVRDLFYGTILPSGADAAVGLACYVAGSHEAFVELMNQELEKLNMSDTTHFTNCVGLYDKNHYSTVYDMAIILKAAADNSFCREVLSAHTYNTSATAQHEEGILISNWFLRRIEDKDTHGEVLCAKTGFVNESKSCAASLATDVNGKEYICVTAGADSSWKCIYDQVKLYQTWLTGN